MRRNRQAKIVATLGPASSTEAMIAALFKAGADVFRLNFSHGTHEEHAERFHIIRRLEAEHTHPIAVLADLQGPKLRVGAFRGGAAFLEQGASFRLDLDAEPGDARRAPLPHPEVFQACRKGSILLIDDGRIQLKATDCGPTFTEAKVLHGGMISDHKGVNVPEAVLDISALTGKDHADLAYALELGVSWIALSFVQRPEDVIAAKQLIGGRANLMAKLEKPSAIKHLESIIEEADGLMVARGDLGVEMAPEDVPMVQKRIVRSCRRAGKPVVVATQMLESMINAPVPTRAEASDVAAAINEGADAVMLSAETAVGHYPVEAVKMMDRIIRRVEGDPIHRSILDAVRPEPRPTASDAITKASRQVAETISAKAIVTCTASGSTTLRASRERPSVPILALTPVSLTARKLTLCWGVHSDQTTPYQDFERMIEEAARYAVAEGFATVGDRLVITAGLPLMVPGKTTELRIVTIAERDGVVAAEHGSVSDPGA
jgi:pyruvate kinase